MQRHVVDIRAQAIRNSEIVLPQRFGGLAEMFLLIANQMLCTSDHTSTLNALNCLSYQTSGEHWIGTVQSQSSQIICLADAHLKPSQFRPPSGDRPSGPATGPRVISTPLP